MERCGALTGGSWRRRLLPLAVAAQATAAVPAARAATLPAGFAETRVASGLSSPAAFALAPDGRIFICEQGGALRVVKNGALLQTPFVSLSVDPVGERGLLGVAFDPAFATNQYVYVYYTVPSSPRHNRVSRFTANGDVAAAGSETVLLELDDLSGATNHNGGAIHFGPDGKLYVAVGDNANGANSQTLANRLGKVLRINSDGSIPADNPFYGQASGANRAIWALGLRNPFTFAFDAVTGRMFVNDVGQSTWEEINDGLAGRNYGWPSSEGPASGTPNPAFTYPLFAYGHGSSATTGCAITGGAFYDAARATFPREYHGAYFFADACSGWIRRFDPATGTATGFATGVNYPVDLFVSPSGDLHYLARGSGEIWSISHPAGAGASPSLVELDDDGRDDVLWRDRTGALYAWLMNGTSVGSGSGSLPFVSPTWRIAAVADLDGNGRGDILWRDAATGATYVWLLSGATIAGQGYTSAQADGTWRVEGAADFDGDGSADILWRNASGVLHLWQMSGATVSASLPVASVNPSWRIHAIADVSGDGRADLVWREASSAATYVWLLSGATVVGQGATTAQADAAWQVQAAGDLDGDDRDDLVWRHSSGAVYLWLMNGATVKAGSGFLPGVGATWGLVGAGDLNGDGFHDLLWRESASGSTYAWLMNGATVASQGFTSGQASPSWRTQPPLR